MDTVRKALAALPDDDPFFERVADRVAAILSARRDSAVAQGERMASRIEAELAEPRTVEVTSGTTPEQRFAGVVRRVQFGWSGGSPKESVNEVQRDLEGNAGQ